MRERPEVQAEEMDLAAIMHALADPSRLRMVAALDGQAERNQMMIDHLDEGVELLAMVEPEIITIERVVEHVVEQLVGPRLVIGPVRSGVILDHVGHVIVFGDVRRLYKPVYCRGLQGLWTVPPSAEEEIRWQLAPRPRPEPDMQLPAGQTCAGCGHFRYCQGFINRKGPEVECDWSPSRFAWPTVYRKTPSWRPTTLPSAATISPGATASGRSDPTTSA